MVAYSQRKGSHRAMRPGHVEATMLRSCVVCKRGAKLMLPATMSRLYAAACAVAAGDCQLSVHTSSCHGQPAPAPALNRSWSPQKARLHRKRYRVLHRRGRWHFEPALGRRVTASPRSAAVPLPLPLALALGRKSLVAVRAPPPFTPSPRLRSSTFFDRATKDHPQQQQQLRQPRIRSASGCSANHVE